MNYQDFILSKQHIQNNYGIKAIYFPEIAFDYQKYVIENAVMRGRVAIFADTGLGKTLIQLSIANNYKLLTNKRVLIITPIAVAFQFLLEAEKLGIDDIEYSKDGRFTKKIVICNYERLHYFNSDDFETVILDESSILKNFDGIIKSKLTSFMKKIKYRFLSTATPSPNDYIELGTSSEILGFMGYIDMLTKFFKNNVNSIDNRNWNDGKFYLKKHAEKDFWSWVNSWSLSLKKPSDLGFSDEKHILPQLIENIHVINNKERLIIDNQIMIFNDLANSFKEIKCEVNNTIDSRCEKAFELSLNHDTTVYWVNLNKEAKKLKSLDNNAIEIDGSMNIDKKEEILYDFSNGKIKNLITKPSITSFGLNWQHCNHTVFFPTYSYEQYYQSIRRFYRFGQKRDVIVDIVSSNGQKKIIDTLKNKNIKAITMYENLIKNTRKFEEKEKEEISNFIIPSFL